MAKQLAGKVNVKNSANCYAPIVLISSRYMGDAELEKPIS